MLIKQVRFNMSRNKKRNIGFWYPNLKFILKYFLAIIYKLYLFTNFNNTLDKPMVIRYNGLKELDIPYFYATLLNATLMHSEDVCCLI